MCLFRWLGVILRIYLIFGLKYLIVLSWKFDILSIKMVFLFDVFIVLINGRLMLLYIIIFLYCFFKIFFIRVVVVVLLFVLVIVIMFLFL